MLFRPPPERPDPPPAREHRAWFWLLLGSAAATAACSLLPWIRVRFVGLFGSHLGPPGWHTSAGFTCLCTSALVAVMALAEDHTPSTQRAVRPGSLMLVGISALVLAVEWNDGPGFLRGVTASWTGWFYGLLLAVPFLLATCTLRWLLASARSA